MQVYVYVLHNIHMELLLLCGIRHEVQTIYASVQNIYMKLCLVVDVINLHTTHIKHYQAQMKTCPLTQST